MKQATPSDTRLALGMKKIFMMKTNLAFYCGAIYNELNLLQITIINSGKNINILKIPFEGTKE